MVFEKLGLSLYDFLKKNSYRPFHLDLVSVLCNRMTATDRVSFTANLKRSIGPSVSFCCHVYVARIDMKIPFYIAGALFWEAAAGINILSA